MFTRRLRWLIGGVVVILLAGLAAFWLSRPASSIDLIQVGMTRAEVEAIFGPELAPSHYARAESHYLCLEGNLCVMYTLPKEAQGRDKQVVWFRHWVGVHPLPKPSMWWRIRAWLGWR